MKAERLFRANRVNMAAKLHLKSRDREQEGYQREIGKDAFAEYERR